MKRPAVIFLCIILSAAPVVADDDIPSINENGQVGGLHLPTARTLEPGTAYIGAGKQTFYKYGFVGLQPVEDLRLVIRQDSDKYGITFPGLDAQIQLLDESDWVPETAMGFTHMVGQPRFAGEYLAFNKKYEDLDFGLGLGWGSYAQNGALHNFLGLSDTNRNDGELGSEGPGAWFHGDQIGLFGSVSYQTPWHPLQLVAEFDRDPYFQERFENELLGSDPGPRRAPVNLGAHVTLVKGLALSAEVDALSRPSVYITYGFNFYQDDARPESPDHEHLRPAPITDENPVTLDPKQIQTLAWRDGVALEKLNQSEPGIITATYQVDNSDDAYATDLGHAAYAVADHTDNDVVAITLVPEHDGLEGDTYTLLRRDVVHDTQFNGSATEIRQTASVTPTAIDDMPNPTVPDHPRWKLYSIERIDIDPYEFGSFILSRVRAQYGGTYELLHGMTVGATGNANVDNNYPEIFPSEKPVRSNANLYLQRDYDTENLYVNEMQTVAPGLHTRVTAGLLEEMYRGVSSEVLYQPFASRWAAGLEGDWLQQRSPYDDFEKTAYETTPWIASLYYEMLPHDLTIIARVEQYLARDKGLALEFQHEFLHGSKVDFGLDWSNERDFGGLEYRGHLAAMMTLHVPLQYEVAGVPMENLFESDVAPTVRDSGQMVELPTRLWDETRPISYGPILNSWEDFLGF